MTARLEPASDDAVRMAAELRDRIGRDVRDGSLRPLHCEATSQAGNSDCTRTWHELPARFEVAVWLGNPQIPGCPHPDEFEAIPHRLYGIDVEAEVGLEVLAVTCDARLTGYRDDSGRILLTYVCELA